jgi:hypothetical protein
VGDIIVARTPAEAVEKAVALAVGHRSSTWWRK